jgi:hypothetical protein
MPKEGVEPSPPCREGILNPAQQKRKSLENKALTQTEDSVLSSCLVCIIGEYPGPVNIINAWPELPDEARGTIVRIVECVGKKDI